MGRSGWHARSEGAPILCPLPLTPFPRAPFSIYKLTLIIVSLHLVQKLNMADNNLGGTLPASYVDMKNLEMIDLSNNNISGRFLNTPILLPWQTLGV